MANRDFRDITAGLTLGAIGVLCLAMSIAYGIGTVSRMGPGFFPMLVGGAAILLAVAMIIPALQRPTAVPRPAWHPLAGVAGAIAAFALAIEPLGLLPAISLAGAIAAASDRDSKLLQTIALVAFLAVGSWLVFIKGLGMAIPAFEVPL